VQILRHWLVFLALCCCCACSNEVTEDAEIPFGFACNPQESVSDLDDDGYKHPSDCDDHDAAVFPGAQEVCNLIDDNCNDRIDEYTTRTHPYAVLGQADDIPTRYPFTLAGDARDPVTFPVQMSSTDEAAGLVMGDIDLDEIQDVIMQSDQEGWVASYAIDCDDEFTRSELFTVDPGHRLRGIGDVDGDGDLDLVTLSVDTWIGVVWSNDGTGAFERRPEELDWSILAAMTAEGALMGSQLLLDLDGDGFGDWVMCYAQYGKTYCYEAEGSDHGYLREPGHLFTLTDVESNSIALGWFDDDEDVDALVGLLAVDPAGGQDNEVPVYLVEGEDGGGFDDTAQFLFDIAEQAEGVALGFAPDKFGDGWFRTVDLDTTVGDRSEVLILMEVWHNEEQGVSLLFVQDPLDIDPTPGFQDGEFKPVERSALPMTSSYPSDLYDVIATGMSVENPY